MITDNYLFNKREILAFTHIEKAAGTTLIHLLRRNFFLRYLDARPLSADSKNVFSVDDLHKSLIINPFIVCIGGHSVMPYSNLKSKFSNIKYITMLREPIKRYISHYRHWIEKRYKKISFDEFLNIDWMTNFQVKKIAGCENVDAAKEILAKDFFLVGILDEFDAFILLLKKKIGHIRFNPYYKIENTSLDRNTSDDIVNKYYDRIVEKNGLDIALYDYVAKELIPKFVAEYGNGFKRDLDAFKKVNQTSRLNLNIKLKRYIDYIFRKIYYANVTGYIRTKNDMPKKGSY